MSVERSHASSSNEDSEEDSDDRVSETERRFGLLWEFNLSFIDGESISTAGGKAYTAAF